MNADQEYEYLPDGVIQDEWWTRRPLFCSILNHARAVADLDEFVIHLERKGQERITAIQPHQADRMTQRINGMTLY